MAKHILNLMLAGALCLGAGLPVIAQQPHEAEEAFAKLDVDKDEKLSAAEFAKIEIGPEKPAFEDWDVDGDGSISKDEFAAQYESGTDAKPSSEN